VAERPFTGTTVTTNTSNQRTASRSAEPHSPERAIHSTGITPPAITASWGPEIPKNQPTLSRW
jgi:hypothetical protein